MNKKEEKGTRLPSHADWSQYRPLSEGMQELVGELAAGHTGLHWMLSHLAYTTHPLKFQIFCEVIPAGTELVNAFEKQRIPGNPIFAWREFLRKELKKTIKTGASVAPQGCEQPGEERLKRWKLVSRRKAGKKLKLLDVLGAHFGEPIATRRVRYVFCVGCTHEQCTHHLIGPKKPKQKEESGPRPLKDEDMNLIPLVPQKRHLRLVASTPR